MRRARSCLSALASLLSLLLAAGCASIPSSKSTGPWNLEALQTVPAVEWGPQSGRVQALYYGGEPFQGKPTRVFAYLGRPDTRFGDRTPAVLLVHGGGGRAFREWADHWAERGYVALAMDLSGKGPDGRLPDGGPDQSDTVKFREFTREEIPDMWTYHAVAAILRGHALLRSLPEVDPRRVGITGISWGGYLTCIVAGVDPGLKVAVPVYGCGFLGDNSVWKDGALAGMSEDARRLWLRTFDPSRYLARVACPILFLNGTSDFAYPLDSYQKSYQLVDPALRHVCVVVDLPHGHIWKFPEVDAFIDSVLNGTNSLPRLKADELAGDGTLTATAWSPLPLQAAVLCYTTDRGPWNKRQWKTAPARIDGARIIANLPPENPSVAYLMVTDVRGLRASSEHIEWPVE